MEKMDGRDWMDGRKKWMDEWTDGWTGGRMENEQIIAGLN